MSRPPKPTALKVVGGTDRKDRRNGQEPEPLMLGADQLDPPEHLGEASAAVWREVAPMLHRTKVLTEADLIALELMCDAVADYRQARRQRGSELVVETSKGGEMLSQLLVAQQACAKRAETMMGRFGMDPVSRSRVMIQPQGDLFAPPSGPGRFFGGGR